MNRTLQVLAGAFLTLAPLNAARAQVAAAPPAAEAKVDGSSLVPRGHWAYEVLAILSGTDAESQTLILHSQLSRQEFAQAVSKLLENPQAWTKSTQSYMARQQGAETVWSVVARDETRDLLAALRREFADELEGLGARVAFGPVEPLEGAKTREAQARQALAQKAREQELRERERLERLQERLRTLFTGKWEGVALSLEGANLVAQFECHDFVVHPLKWNDEVAPWFSNQRGPNHDGFRLRLSIRQGDANVLLLRPQDKSEPYWTTWRSEFRLNSRETDAAKIAEATKTFLPNTFEYPDVPRGTWPYAALETLSLALFAQPLPNSNPHGVRVMTRYEFAVATVRLLDRIYDKLLTPLQDAAMVKLENQTALQALTGEFTGDLLRSFGEAKEHVLQLAIGTTFFIPDPRIRHEVLQMQLSYGRDTDVALLESIKRAVNDWALEEMRTALALPEAQPKKP